MLGTSVQPLVLDTGVILYPAGLRASRTKDTKGDWRTPQTHKVCSPCVNKRTLPCAAAQDKCSAAKGKNYSTSSDARVNTI
jgi:hypothetical protein